MFQTIINLLFRHSSSCRSISTSTCTRKSQVLTTFLNQTDKDVTSTVYRGTLFELQTLTCLESTLGGMQLQHVGGKSDGGIDLRGSWYNMNIIVQCKNIKGGGCTPDHIRQLMGTTLLNSTNKQQKTIGILSTTVNQKRQFTRDVISLFNSSPVSLGLVSIQDTTLKSVIFNKKAQQQGFLKDLIISTQFDSQGNESLFINIPSSSK